MKKLLPGWETLLLLPVIEVNGEPRIITSTGLVAASAVTTAALNEYIPITTGTAAQGAAGGNISCAVIDDMTLGTTGSDTSDTRTLCSKGNSSTPTLYNFDFEINILRDADLVAPGLFNFARDLIRVPDLPYLAAHRVRGGKDSTELAEVGDEWDFYYAWTDNPVPGYPDSENQTLGQTFVQKGWVNVGYTLTA